MFTAGGLPSRKFVLKRASSCLVLPKGFQRSWQQLNYTHRALSRKLWAPAPSYNFASLKTWLIRECLGGHAEEYFEYFLGANSNCLVCLVCLVCVCVCVCLVCVYAWNSDSSGSNLHLSFHHRKQWAMISMTVHWTWVSCWLCVVAVAAGEDGHHTHSPTSHWLSLRIRVIC